MTIATVRNMVLAQYLKRSVLMVEFDSAISWG